MINAYILAFGGLLLFGGRLGDLYGRRRMLQVGMAIFTIASLFVGLAQDGVSIIASRGLQGMGAALTAPNALALIATTFPEGKARNGAMAVYGAMSGLGIIAGLILGGLLTGLLGWRWAFYINIPIGLAVLAGSRTLVEAELHKGRPDLAGALTSILGMAALVFGITRGGEHGWTDSITLAAFATAVILLPVFLILQARSKDPLLPPRLFKERNRAGSYLAMLLLGFGPMGMIYMLTLYLQHILGYSPIMIGQLYEHLQDEDGRTHAAETFRSLVDQVTLVPDNGELAIVLRGDLGAILRFTAGKKNPDFLAEAEALDNLLSQGSLVAGACIHLHLLFRTAA